MEGYFDLTGGILKAAGGRLVKTIGDAGLGVFPADETGPGVDAFGRLKDDGDAWLLEHGVRCRAVVKVHVGTVVCGPVGPPGDKRFDIYGRTVNTASL